MSETARSRAINASVREYVFFFVLIRYNESHPDMTQYQRDLEKEICESGGGLYLSLTAD